MAHKIVKAVIDLALSLVHAKPSQRMVQYLEEHPEFQKKVHNLNKTYRNLTHQIFTQIHNDAFPEDRSQAPKLLEKGPKGKTKSIFEILKEGNEKNKF